MCKTIPYIMSYLPVYVQPGGGIVDIMTVRRENPQYFWIDSLGGGSVSKPLKHGALRPDGVPAHNGVLVYNNQGQATVYYHYSGR